jgi:hydroxyacylglutathione hydrolase
MAARIHLFRCLQDNFGVLLHDPASGRTAAIDAPEAAAVDRAVSETGWGLTDILVTHHHGDHTAGIPALKQKYGARVTAPRNEKAPIPEVDIRVGEGDRIEVGSLAATVIETPGHTIGQIAYFFAAEKIVFTGDTLFSIGCGRVIEGTPAQMWQSLLKLRALPDDTEIYCGHEYTAANIRFARTIEPDNAALKARSTQVEQLVAEGRPTIPSRMGDEKQANVFLRADRPEVAAVIGMSGRPAADVFAEIRARKNNF